MRSYDFWQAIIELDKKHKGSEDSISLVELIPSEFYNKNLDDYEKREDGKIVRKDRWETGIRSIQVFLRDIGLLEMPNDEFEIPDVVRLVVNHIIQWTVADYDNLDDAISGKYLVTAIDKSTKDESLTVLEAYLDDYIFYFTSDLTQKLDDNFLTVTHFARMPKPAKQDANHD